MTAEILLQTVLSGLLIGLVYALVAVGLTLIFGVMDIVNFAHGEFLMLGMYASFWAYALLGLDPLFTLPFTALGLFAVGVVLYRLVIRRILDISEVSPSLALVLGQGRRQGPERLQIQTGHQGRRACACWSCV